MKTKIIPTLAMCLALAACANYVDPSTGLSTGYFSKQSIQQDIDNATAKAAAFIAKIKADAQAFAANAPTYEAEAKAAIGIFCNAMPLIAALSASATSALTQPPSAVIKANSAITNSAYVTNQSCTAYTAVANSPTPPTPIDTVNQAIGLANAVTAGSAALKTIQTTTGG